MAESGLSLPLAGCSAGLWVGKSFYLGLTALLEEAGFVVWGCRFCLINVDHILWAFWVLWLLLEVAIIWVLSSSCPFTATNWQIQIDKIHKLGLKVRE